MSPATPDEIKKATEYAIERLRLMSSVLLAEHNWLLPQIEECRTLMASEIADGWRQPDDADVDSPHLLRDQVDKHLSNLSKSADQLQILAQFFEGLLIPPHLRKGGQQ